MHVSGRTLYAPWYGFLTDYSDGGEDDHGRPNIQRRNGVSGDSTYHRPWMDVLLLEMLEGQEEC